MTTATKLLTAEESAELPDDGRHLELVNRVVVEAPRPRPGHAIECGEIYFAIRSSLAAHDISHAMPNDTGVVTERGPDTVRGPDVA